MLGGPRNDSYLSWLKAATHISSNVKETSWAGAYFIFLIWGPHLILIGHLSFLCFSASWSQPSWKTCINLRLAFPTPQYHSQHNTTSALSVTVKIASYIPATKSNEVFSIFILSKPYEPYGQSTTSHLCKYKFPDNRFLSEFSPLPLLTTSQSPFFQKMKLNISDTTVICVCLLRLKSYLKSNWSASVKSYGSNLKLVNWV